MRAIPIGCLIMLAGFASAQSPAVGPLGGSWSLELAGGGQRWDPAGYVGMMEKFFDAKSRAFLARLDLSSASGATDWSTSMDDRAAIMEATIRFHPWRLGGPAIRLAWQAGPEGRAAFAGTGSNGERLTYSNTVEVASFAVLLGGWAGGRLGPARFLGSLFAGPTRARAVFSEDQSWNAAPSFSLFPTPGSDFTESAWVFGLEAEIEAGVAVSRSITIFASAGWRQLKADRFMTYPEDSSPYTGPDQVLDETFVSALFSGGRYADWDFSGVRGALGLRLGL